MKKLYKLASELAPRFGHKVRKISLIGWQNDFRLRYTPQLITDAQRKELERIEEYVGLSPKTKTVKLIRITRARDALVAKILAACPAIDEIEIAGCLDAMCPRGVEGDWATLFEEDVFVGRTCKLLRQIGPKIRTARLTFDVVSNSVLSTDIEATVYLGWFTNVKDLEVRFAKLDSIEFSDLQCFAFAQLVHHLPDLERLALVGIDQVKTGLGYCSIMLPPGLQHLHLEDMNILAFDLDGCLKVVSPSLRSLALVDVECHLGAEEFATVHALPKLNRLCIASDVTIGLLRLFRRAPLAHVELLHRPWASWCGKSTSRTRPSAPRLPEYRFKQLRGFLNDHKKTMKSIRATAFMIVMAHFDRFNKLMADRGMRGEPLELWATEKYGPKKPAGDGWETCSDEDDF